MAEQKRGFHALEERIHQMEEEDAKQDATRRAAQKPESGGERGEPREGAPGGTAPTRK